MTCGVHCPPISAYDINYQVETLHDMRDRTVAALTKVAKEFPEGIQCYARVVFGGAARQILHATLETVSLLPVAHSRDIR